MEYNDELMILAFAEASKALEIGEVPVGAVFYDLNTKKIIARGCNSVNATKNATRHAELNCIDEVLDSVEKHDFEKVVVYVNVEVKLCLSNNQHYVCQITNVNQNRPCSKEITMYIFHHFFQPCIMCAGALLELNVAAM